MNLTGAFEVLLRAAQMGNPRAQFLVGAMYSQGLGTQPDQARAILYHTFAARAGQVPSLMALAYKKYYGIGVPVDCYAAAKYYAVVAEHVVRDYKHITGRVRNPLHLALEEESTRESKNDDLLQYYRLSAESGDLAARVGLGQFYLKGLHGAEQDLDEALLHLLIAADQGRPAAMGLAGAILYERNDTDDSVERASRLFQSGAEKDDPLSLNFLGMMLLHGIGVPKESHRAVALLHRAADKHQPDAQVNLGVLYSAGTLLPRKREKARELFTGAVRQGHLLGRYYLGLLNLGDTPESRVSCTLAFSMLKAVAEADNETAGHDGLLAMAHEDFREGRYNSSAVRFLLAAEQGLEEAQANAAHLIASGLASLPTSNKTTVLLANLMRAAAQGSVEAKVRLGDLFYSGREGVPANLGKAAAFYTVANLANSAEAMFNLGYMHEHGYGVSLDLVQAKRYYDKARETSEDASLPATLALAKLGAKLLLSGGDLLGFYDLASKLGDKDGASLFGWMLAGLAEGALIFTLGLGLGILILIRTRL